MPNAHELKFYEFNLAKKAVYTDGSHEVILCCRKKYWKHNNWDTFVCFNSFREIDIYNEDFAMCTK